MNIFHGIVEIAGQMGILSDALKAKGHYSVGYNTFHSYLGYKDHLVNTDLNQIKANQEDIINSFDIFHFHYNTTLHENHEDLPYLQSKRKK